MRTSRIDVARGLLILYIVTIVHACYWLQLYNGPRKSFILFEMPCIFFISGYSYALSLKNGMSVNTVGQYLQYVKKRAERVLIPYWLYVAACLLLVLTSGDPAFSAAGGDTLATVWAWVNPLSYGSGHSFLSLNFHLWFVAPFLGVAFLMPLLAKLISWIPLPIPVLLSIGLALIVAGSLLHLGDLPRNLLTYLTWSLLGFVVASKTAAAPIRRWQMMTCCLVSGLLLWLVHAFRGASMDMQFNKFPPNAVFFIFCLGWISLLACAWSFVKDSTLDRLRRRGWFRPFVEKGYSIYMWQGIGYTLAQMAGAQFSVPLPWTWTGAIALTVCLGILASPVESLGFPGRWRIRSALK